MGKRGTKPKRKEVVWSPDIAYVVGLIATDGCLAGDRHIILVSKDGEQLENVKRILGLQVSISYATSGYTGKKTSRIQFGDVTLRRFFESIGLTQNKTKTIGALDIPEDLFWDFLRGAYDGDGSSYSYWDSRWKSSFMFYTTFVSASEAHIVWLRDEIHKRLGVLGHVSRSKTSTLVQLRYAKSDSVKILTRMYYTQKVACLTRKRLKIEKILGTVGVKLKS